jgi:hypothetical protein
LKFATSVEKSIRWRMEKLEFQPASEKK